MPSKRSFEKKKSDAIAENEARYGEEARSRWGNKTVDAANEKLRGLSEQQWEEAQALGEKIIERLKQAMAEGNPQSAAAQELVELHAKWLRIYWPEGLYSPQAHVSLAEGYLAAPRFVQYYDSRAGSGATEFLVKAIKAALKG
ncbi:MAG: TipAS antibiotic-recognition domain-containing protein [Tractidigestivibacter sp.]|jgi:hypothetical protein|uniref:TipAS antibiotic-recognition domain-containing protein n=1 Tax=Tractidigestivibacter sp. TaxID=2847320 RepID=UPI003D8CE011